MGPPCFFCSNLNLKIMRKLFLILLVLCVFCCCDNKDTGVDNGIDSLKGQITLDNLSTAEYDNCHIITVSGESEILNGSFDISTMINNCVQSFFVYDDNNNVLLMSRIPTTWKQQIEINERTSAIAMVSMHPLFSPLNEEEYAMIESLVTNSPCFDRLLQEVCNAINAKRNLYDETNENLLLALSDLLEDICGQLEDDGNYSEDLEDIISTTVDANSRTVYDHPSVYPFYVEINRNVLTIRNTGLTPSYYGYVVEASGKETNFYVPARADYGGIDLFTNSLDEISLGEARTFVFSEVGEYRFCLSRMNSVATADFTLRLANSLLTAIGVDIKYDNDVLLEVSNMISQALINAGSGVNDNLTDPMTWVGIGYSAVLKWMQKDFWEEIGQTNIIAYGKVLSGSLNFYNKIKGVVNGLFRLAYSVSAPEEVNFCLCYYDGVVSTCSSAILTTVSGNFQSGFANQRLLLPLEVDVQSLENDQPNSATSYHRVKYEVKEGGGRVASELVSVDQNGNASTYWTLGARGDQSVRVVVVDIVTGKEISDPVYFYATLDVAQITIRLDWSKHSDDTDIDLHVVDPYGEKIYYSHMHSASGGYLDRDDRVGPGPEHIRWNEAPTGTYKVYVHYYPNGASDRSVTSYKVTVNAGGVSYTPKTGSIAYDQYVPVGQFTIGTDTISNTIAPTSAGIKPADKKQ